VFHVVVNVVFVNVVVVDVVDVVVVVVVDDVVVACILKDQTYLHTTIFRCPSERFATSNK
jgi:hypothetical protein